MGDGLSAGVRFHYDAASEPASRQRSVLPAGRVQAQPAPGGARWSDKIAVYLSRMRQAADVPGLGATVDDLCAEVRFMHLQQSRAAAELLDARRRLERAQEKIGMLEADLGQMRVLIGSDGLTGCLNRRGLENGMERELARCDRTRSPVSVTVLDVDNFKRLNDTYGHLAGDRALVHLTAVLRRALRPTDMIARYGGEEFVLVLPDTGAAEAVKITNRLRRELAAAPFHHQGERLDIAFSAGVAQRARGEAAQAVIARADQAVYGAKRAGKNRVLRAPASGGPGEVRNSCR